MIEYFVILMIVNNVLICLNNRKSHLINSWIVSVAFVVAIKQCAPIDRIGLLAQLEPIRQIRGGDAELAETDNLAQPRINPFYPTLAIKAIVVDDRAVEEFL